MNPPIITVIIAVFNGAAKLQRCLDSLAEQTYPYKELIVIDGGSTDGTIEILKNNNEKITYWESEPDRGIYHAWNKALSKATGDWIIFLGADDYLWNSEVLANAAGKLVFINSDIRVVYGRVAMVSPQNNEVLQIFNKSWHKSRKKFMQYSNIHHQGIFHHRSLFSEHGLFDDSFKIAGDYELLLRELKNKDAHFLEDIIISGAQIKGLSSSPENYIKTYREFYKARGKNNITTLPFRLGWLYVKACIRVILLRTFGEQYSDIIADLYRKVTLRPSIWTRL